MNLTTKSLAFGKGVYVNGGHIVRLDHEVSVSSAGYSKINEPATTVLGPGGQSPAATQERVIAQIGDLAIEIVSPRKGGEVIGWYFLTGEATNVVLYVDQRSDRPPTFTRRKGIRIDPSFKSCEVEPLLQDDIIESMFTVKYSDADVAFFELLTQDESDMMAAGHALAQSYSYMPPGRDSDDRDPEAGTHLIGTLESKRPKKLMVLHCQPPKDGSDYCAKGFAAELLRTSKCLEKRTFWHPIDMPKIERVKKWLLHMADDADHAHGADQAPAHFREAIEALPDRSKFVLLAPDVRAHLERVLAEFGV